MSEYCVRLGLISPCFCAGANQQEAELRVPSLRGQLRWWFRVLGGSRQQELELFGGQGREEGEQKQRQPHASKVRLRISDKNNSYGNAADLPANSNQALGYLLHFARVSGNDAGIKRFEKGGWLAPGSTFTLQASILRQIHDQADLALFKQAWHCLVNLGSVGLRQTRGMGAWGLEEAPSLADFKAGCSQHCPNLDIWYIEKDGRPAFSGSNDWRAALRNLEASLGWLRQNGYSAGQKGDNPTPLGKSGGGRQASALHLRPVKLQEGLLPLLFYTPSVLENKEAEGSFEGFLTDMRFKTPYRQKVKDQADDNREELVLRRL
ncbi:MAG: type III-B CRISPR module RAMP protein Cmr1 [Lentisphaerae bacterium]|nr:type III-B CRISPR module RAMP protein Cmr1 [Lentisphaerota bacterium]